jgi:hypothetical protein
MVWAVAGAGSDHGAVAGRSGARGNPNWWVILAVSLALMALLVATSGGGGDGRRTPRASQAADRNSPGAPHGHVAAPRQLTTTTTSRPTTPTIPETTTTAASPASSSSSADTRPASGSVLTGTSSAPTTLPSAAPPTTTTTTTTGPSQTAIPPGRTQNQGYIDPPLDASNQFGFTGTGNMMVSVVWSGNTYLTMSVSCPSGGNDAGGTSVMEASLPNASGNCTATVTEPSSESVSLTYTISWGPADG